MKTYYIIRHKTSLRWLPSTHQRNLTSVNLTDKQPPRLFNSRSAATNALHWWAGGIWYHKYSDEYNPIVDQVYNRCKANMEICEVIITIKEPTL